MVHVVPQMSDGELGLVCALCFVTETPQAAPCVPPDTRLPAEPVNTWRVVCLAQGRDRVNCAVSPPSPLLDRVDSEGEGGDSTIWCF